MRIGIDAGGVPQQTFAVRERKKRHPVGTLSISEFYTVWLKYR